MTTESIKLWLDDRRPAPEGWALVSTVEEAKALLRVGKVTHASLDYDLGPGQPTGLDLIEWMNKHHTWPSGGAPEVHSGHPIGRIRMKRQISLFCPLAKD